MSEKSTLIDKIEVNTRKSITAPMTEFCHLSKNHDVIEVTEWHNGEGVDVTISHGDDCKIFSLTHGELDAITILIGLLK